MPSPKMDLEKPEDSQLDDGDLAIQKQLAAVKEQEAEEEISLIDEDSLDPEGAADLADDDSDQDEVDYEALAREQGWRPEEEYQGDPSKWIPAKEFVDRKPFFDTISKQSKSIKKLEKTIDALIKHNKEVSQKEFDRAKKYLEEQRRLAAEDNDAAGLLEIQEKLDSLKEPEFPELEPQSEEEAMEDFRSRNPWYDDKPRVRYAVDGYMSRYTRGKNLTPAEMAEEAERFAREAFPEEFEVKPRQTRVAPSSRRQAPTGSRRKLTLRERIATLTAEEKMVAQAFKRDGEMSVEEYLEQLGK